MLRRGANVNDRDDLTDLTLLHYACKSGAGESMSEQMCLSVCECVGGGGGGRGERGIFALGV